MKTRSDWLLLILGAIFSLCFRLFFFPFSRLLVIVYFFAFRYLLIMLLCYVLYVNLVRSICCIAPFMPPEFFCAYAWFIYNRRRSQTIAGDHTIAETTQPNIANSMFASDRSWSQPIAAIMDAEDSGLLIGVDILLLSSLLKRRIAARSKKELRFWMRKKQSYFLISSVNCSVSISPCFHLVKTHTRVKADKQLVVVVSCRL